MLNIWDNFIVLTKVPNFGFIRVRSGQLGRGSKQVIFKWVIFKQAFFFFFSIIETNQYNLFRENE